MQRRDPSRRIVVLGGGISGLTAAYRLRRLLPGADVVLLEKEPALGGKARTTVRDGYTVEWGPNGFLTNASDTLDLARELGLEDDLVVAAHAAGSRYLYRDGGLRPIPTSPPAFLGTELVSPMGKLRAALEPVLAARRGEEETVHAFLARHFGREVADAFAEAMVLGISGGDPRGLSLDALFPRMRRLEAQHRSLVLGAIASLRTVRRGAGSPREGSVGARGARGSAGAGGTSGERGPGAGSGRLTSLRGGVAQLVDALERALGGAVRTGARAVAVRPARMDEHRGMDGREDARGHRATDGQHPAWGQQETLGHEGRGRLEILLEDGTSIRAGAAILAVPAHAASRLVAGWNPAAAAALDRIEFAPIWVLGLGYDRVDIPRVLDGFGFLAPSGEGVRSLGALWSSSVFPNHAPAGKALVRVLAGGVRDPGIVDLEPEAALAAVREDLRATMGITAMPELVEHVVWPKAIPQYRIGHAAIVADAEAALANAPGLALTGYSFRGIGLNDCIRDATSVAHTVAHGLPFGGPGASRRAAPLADADGVRHAGNANRIEDVFEDAPAQDAAQADEGA